MLIRNLTIFVLLRGKNVEEIGQFPKKELFSKIFFILHETQKFSEFANYTY